MRIDIHNHMWPDKIAAQVVAGVNEDLGYPPALNGTAAELEAAMARGGIDKAVILGVAMRADLTPKTNDWLKTLPDHYIPFGSIHPDYADKAAEVERLKQMGFKGIKVHSLFQGMRPDDERLLPIYDTVGEDMVVLFHAGMGSVEKGNDSPPSTLLRIRKLFPRLKMIIAHWGGVDQQDAVKELLWGEPVWFDTSCPPAFSEAYPNDHLVQFVRTVGAERILFGSDSPFADPARELEALHRLPLTSGELEAIAGENARRLLGL